MTEIKSELLLASVNAITGDVLYTFKWTYPRIILAEVNTHRMLSRNTSSSRAIPSKRQRAKVLHDPFVPVSIGAAKKGMQGGEELSGFKRAVAVCVWKAARYPAILGASILDRLGVHKQVSNRLVEPWTWTEQLVSATDLDNLFNLRANEMAEPHFQILAYQAKEQWEWVKFVVDKIGIEGIWEARDLWEANRIKVVGPDEWHLPFVSSQEFAELGNTYLAKRISAARCARVSYNMPDTGKKSSKEDDLRIFAQLAGGDPKHLSPVEHQATPMIRSEYSGNFCGWKQFRKELE